MSNTPVPASDPQLTIQTASLWSSGNNNVFAGTGGPQGYDPWTGQFGDVVSSSGIDATPFQDGIWDIQAGDEITFVIAVQNRGSIGAAYDTVLQDVMPSGFVVPDAGTGLSVTDGAGNPLNFTGDLFNTPLVLQDPIAPYDPSSGANVDLVTFDLQAATNLAVPAAQLANAATIVSYAGAEGGPSLASEVDPATLTASTQVNTAGYTVQVTPEQAITTLLSNQQASYDVTVTLPLGETRNLHIHEVLPHSGNSWLQLASAEIMFVGSGIAANQVIAVQPDGSVNFGDVLASPDSATGTADAAADSIKLRVTVRGAGTSAGQGTLNVSVSAADPNHPDQLTNDTVSNVLPLAAPDTPPTIAKTSVHQNATDSATVMPFAKLTLTDPDPGQQETLTIHLSDPLMGNFSSSQGSYNPTSGNYTITGTIAAVQQAARSLTFSTGPGRSGTEQFGLTLDDGAGGVATDSSTALNVTTATSGASIQHFPLSAGQTILTSSATGTQTIAEVETYAGPVDYLQYQFIYDGSDALAMSAQSPNIFIKNVAGSAAVQLLSGQNVVDAGHGSNFLISGAGQDVFYLDARQLSPTWDTIVNFHTGDIATIWGYQDGVSSYRWEDNAGATGYTGRTLRLDITGNGQSQESLTFAGKTATDTSSYAVTSGSIGGTNYMAIFAL